MSDADGRAELPTENVLASKPFEIRIEVIDGQWTALVDELGIEVRGDVTDTDTDVADRADALIRKIAAGYDLSDDALSPESYDLKTRFIEAGWLDPRPRGSRRANL